MNNILRDCKSEKGICDQGILDAYLFNLLFLVFSFVFCLQRQYENRYQPNEWQSKWKDYPECLVFDIRNIFLQL